MTTRKAKLHVREFVADTLTPVAVYERLAALSPVRFLFESVTVANRSRATAFWARRRAPWCGSAPRASRSSREAK